MWNEQRKIGFPSKRSTRLLYTAYPVLQFRLFCESAQRFCTNIYTGKGKRKEKRGKKKYSVTKVECREISGDLIRDQTDERICRILDQTQQRMQRCQPSRLLARDGGEQTLATFLFSCSSSSSSFSSSSSSSFHVRPSLLISQYTRAIHLQGTVFILLEINEKLIKLRLPWRNVYSPAIGLEKLNKGIWLRIGVEGNCLFRFLRN